MRSALPGRFRVPDGPRLHAETGEGTHNRAIPYDPAAAETKPAFARLGGC